ncbi:MAG: hypothetical protein ACYCPW_00970 [Nitrososphaerales archaeon]
MEIALPSYSVWLRAWQVQAVTTIVPAQDLVDLGPEARMNFPEIVKGTGDGA